MAKLDCGHDPSPHSEFTTGYGIDSDGKKHCYDCCGKQDEKDMIESGRATLYLTCENTGMFRPRIGEVGDYKVTNWPGSLSFKVLNCRIGRHNIAGRRYDVWFYGPDKVLWHGVQYGDNTQICHCKRNKH